MNFILGVLAALGFIAFTTLVFLFGFFVCAEDAKRSLTGNKPVDDFWRRRGMK